MMRKNVFGGSLNSAQFTPIKVHYNRCSLQDCSFEFAPEGIIGIDEQPSVI